LTVRPRLAIAAAAFIAFGVAAFFIYGETRRAERDRHAILNQMRELERMIRDHDGKLFLEVESEHKGDRPADDPNHDAMLRDFEVLSHLDGFRIKDVVVLVQGDAATATYRVEGRPRDVHIPGLAVHPVVVPRGGEIQFLRRSGGWAMTAHRFVP